MVLGVRRDDMVVVLMVAGHMLTVRIIDHMVLIPLSGMTAMMRRVSVPAAMMAVLRERSSGAEGQDTNDGERREDEA